MRTIIWDHDGALFDADSAIGASCMLTLNEAYGIHDDALKFKRRI